MLAQLARHFKESFETRFFLENQKNAYTGVDSVVFPGSSILSVG